MKKNHKLLMIILTLILGMCTTILAQPHTGGNPADEPGNPPSIGAPVGDGLVYLMIFASLYLGIKMYSYFKLYKRSMAGVDNP